MTYPIIIREDDSDNTRLRSIRTRDHNLYKYKDTERRIGDCELIAFEDVKLGEYIISTEERTQVMLNAVNGIELAWLENSEKESSLKNE